jgi:hypothetical protein
MMITNIPSTHYATLSPNIVRGTVSPWKKSCSLQFLFFHKKWFCAAQYRDSGLPEGRFAYQNPNLGKFLRALEWKLLVYCTTIWYTLYVHTAIWYIARQYDILYDLLGVIFWSNILWLLDNFFTFWYFVPRKLWQTLHRPCHSERSSEWESL